VDWSPAWVRWRHGEGAIGWCPMPPDEIVAETEADPGFWLFVEPRHIVAPSIAVVVMPPAQTVVFLRETVVVNQTVVVRGPNGLIVANPGLPPAFIAARIGAPIRPVSIKPYVIAGTVGVIGAGIVARGIRGAVRREVVPPQAKFIQPAKVVVAPTPFRLGQPHPIGPDGPATLRRAGFTSATIPPAQIAKPVVGKPLVATP